jgi:hypothetical protein
VWQIMVGDEIALVIELQSCRSDCYGKDGSFLVSFRFYYMDFFEWFRPFRLSSIRKAETDLSLFGFVSGTTFS